MYGSAALVAGLIFLLQWGGWGPGLPQGSGLTRGRAPQHGRPPLYFTALTGNEEVARVLLQAGADKHAKDKVTAGRILV